MDNGPGYTLEDLVFYAGLFSGIIAMYFLLQPLAEYEVAGYPVFSYSLTRLVAGIVVGAGIGWLLVQLYKYETRPPEE